MKSPLQDFYNEPSLEQEPVFFSASGAPAGSAASPEREDRDDVSDRELVSGSDNDLPLDSGQIQSEEQSHWDTVHGGERFLMLRRLLISFEAFPYLGRHFEFRHLEFLTKKFSSRTS